MSGEREALALAVQTGTPVLLWGPPGIGKTSYIMALGEALDAHVEVVIASIREPSDFCGLPVIREDGVEFVAPAWAYRLVQQENKRKILCFDEISTAPPANQAGLLRVTLDRVVGELPLPDNVSIVAAANPPEQAAGGWDLSPPLANRFMHIEWPLDASTWADGIVGGWPLPKVPALPPAWESYAVEQQTLVAAFIKARPHLLLNIPSNESQAGKAWPSPRSWAAAARVAGAVQAVGFGEEVSLVAISGCVGNGAALEFLSWRRALDLPDPEEVLRYPEQFKLPSRGDQIYAVLASVVAAAVSLLTKDRWLAAWTVLARAADQGAVDVAAWAARTLARARTTGLPLPKDEILRFTPLLKAAGLL